MLDKHELVIRKIDHFSMFVDRNDPGISATLMRPKFFRKWHREPDFMDIIEKEVGSGDVAFDLGANIGYVSMFLAKYVGESGKVYAVEPSPRNYEILKENINLNKLTETVQAFNLAVSSETGTTELNISKESNLNSFRKTKHTIDTIQVKTTSIDDFFEDKPGLNFIKMDIEGAEVEALKGINSILGKLDRPFKILMEVHPMYYDEDEFANELRRLFSLGFKTKYVVSAGSYNPPFFIERGYEPIKKYKTGDWTRGVYKNVKDEDVIESTSKLFDDHIFNLPISAILKNPTRIMNYKVSSPKIVRSILIERS